MMLEAFINMLFLADLQPVLIWMGSFFSNHIPMKPLSSKNLKRRSNQKKVRPVRCIDTGVVYASSSDASDLLMEQGIDVCPRGILHTCQGIQKKTGGLRWEYAK